MKPFCKKRLFFCYLFIIAYICKQMLIKMFTMKKNKVNNNQNCKVKRTGLTIEKLNNILTKKSKKNK